MDIYVWHCILSFTEITASGYLHNIPVKKTHEHPLKYENNHNMVNGV